MLFVYYLQFVENCEVALYNVLVTGVGEFSFVYNNQPQLYFSTINVFSYSGAWMREKSKQKNKLSDFRRFF